MMALPPGGSTCADPPPEIIPTSACPPIIAMVWTLDGLIGSTVGLFFSRTMLFPLVAGRLQILSRHPPHPSAADRPLFPIETRHTELGVHGRQFPTAELCRLQLLLSA